MKCKLSDICAFRKGKVEVDGLTISTYVSTENMLPNKGGITEATSLPTTALTQEYKSGDVLVSNIRPYFKKIWKAKHNVQPFCVCLYIIFCFFDFFTSVTLANLYLF